MTKLEEIVQVLTPYLHEHITPSARTVVARKVIKLLKTPDDAMLAAAAEVFRQPRWTQRMLFEAVLDAALNEGKTDGR